MTTKWSWFDRQFNFDFPVGKMPDILERLRGTPARVDERIHGIDSDVLTNGEGKTWSVQENIGHLADLEPLWLARVGDIRGGAEVMREADLTNAGTFAAEHNSKTIEDVTSTFRLRRGELIVQLEQLDETEAAKTSLHPRLGKPMRIVDVCFFVADHDDYHLARMTELIRNYAK